MCKWRWLKICPITKKKIRQTMLPTMGSFCYCAALQKVLSYFHIYLGIKQFFKTDQHGFRVNRSATSNLLGPSQYVVTALHIQNQVNEIYTEFSKAFNKVDQSLILHRPKTNGCVVLKTVLIKIKLCFSRRFQFHYFVSLFRIFQGFS